MTALFDHDPAENDRLLRAESQRREDLIHQAVTSFAPHLAGKSDVEAIYLHTTNASLRKAIRTMFEGSKVIVVEHALGGGKPRKGVNEIVEDGNVWLKLPRRADIVATKSNINVKTEVLAMQLGALVCVLPESEDYLRARLKKSGVLIIVGADQGRK